MLFFRIDFKFGITLLKTKTYLKLSFCISECIIRGMFTSFHKYICSCLWINKYWPAIKSVSRSIKTYPSVKAEDHIQIMLSTTANIYFTICTIWANASKAMGCLLTEAFIHTRDGCAVLNYEIENQIWLLVLRLEILLKLYFCLNIFKKPICKLIWYSLPLKTEIFISSNRCLTFITRNIFQMFQICFKYFKKYSKNTFQIHNPNCGFFRKNKLY